jgi:hypothetical protein
MGPLKPRPPGSIRSAPDDEKTLKWDINLDLPGPLGDSSTDVEKAQTSLRWPRAASRQSGQQI